MAMFAKQLARQGNQLAKGFRAPLTFQVVRCASSILKQKGITIEVTHTDNPKPKIHEQVDDPAKIEFGKHFSDHMLLINWTKEGGWESPKITPFQNLSLSPGLSALHYATECFEGLKAFHGVDGKIRLFRPMENLKRLTNSAIAASLPEFDKEVFLECIKDLVRVDREWVPKAKDTSLYVRPTFIGTEPTIGVRASEKALLYCITCPVGPYFSTGTFTPISLYADPAFIRAWPGGAGECKMGG